METTAWTPLGAKCCQSDLPRGDRFDHQHDVGYSNIDKNLEKLSLTKDILNPSEADPVTIEENIELAVYGANNVKIKHGNQDEGYSKYLCNAMSQMSNSHTADEGSVSVRKTYRPRCTNVYVTQIYCHMLPSFVAQGVMEMIPAPPFTIRKANQSSQHIPASRE